MSHRRAFGRRESRVPRRFRSLIFAFRRPPRRSLWRPEGWSDSAVVSAASRSVRRKDSSGTKLGRIRPFGVDGHLRRRRSHLLRLKSRSQGTMRRSVKSYCGACGDLVSDDCASGFDAVARLGRRRTSTDERRISASQCCPRYRSPFGCFVSPKTTLRGKAQQSNRRPSRKQTPSWATSAPNGSARVSTTRGDIPYCIGPPVETIFQFLENLGLRFLGRVSRSASMPIGKFLYFGDFLAIPVAVAVLTYSALTGGLGRAGLRRLPAGWTPTWTAGRICHPSLRLPSRAAVFGAARFSSSAPDEFIGVPSFVSVAYHRRR